MIEMRLSLLLLIVPVVAYADASTPGAPASPLPVALFPASTTGSYEVTVGFGSDGKIHVRVRGGGELVLEPAGQAYVGKEAWKVDATMTYGGPVPLVKVSSRPEACSDYWDIYVSIVGGVPRKALELYSIADPPVMQETTAKLHGATAVVTSRASDEAGDHIEVHRTRWRWNGTVYEQILPVSKRLNSVSK